MKNILITAAAMFGLWYELYNFLIAFKKWDVFEIAWSAAMVIMISINYYNFNKHLFVDYWKNKDL